MTNVEFAMQEYQAFVNRGVILDDDSQRERLLLGALGLAGEAGEVIDHIKKHVFHGKPLDRAAVILELGDSLWYFTVILRALGITWDEVIDGNIEKLTARYPERHGTWRR